MKLILFLLLIVFSVSVFADEFDNMYNGQRDFNAIQSIYTEGVPHTDKNGNVLLEYDKEKSFFQIGSWGVPQEDGEYNWQELKDLGINTVWPYPIYSYDTQMSLAEKYDFQVVVMHSMTDENLKDANNNPHFLANCLRDEPVGLYGPNLEKFWGEFLEYKNHVKEIAPGVSVFNNDTTWNSEPATSWWTKLNKAGDIVCQDAYAVFNDNHGPARTLAHNNINLPNSVAWSAAINDEKKPVWLIVGCFNEPCEYGRGNGFRQPTPDQLRSCVYSGIIHGATGIIYFIWDSFISREGNVIGMSPDPKFTRGNGDPKYVTAKPVDLINAKANWNMAKQINAELKELTPYILSPTSKDNYKVHIEGKRVSPNSLRCMLKPDGSGGYILISSNIDSSWLEAEYTFDKDIFFAQSLFENQKLLKVNDHKFKVTYEPFETHIIHIK